MRIEKKVWVVLLAGTVLLSNVSYGWWDTQIQVVRQPPTVLDLQAESLEEVPAEVVVADTKAWEGKAVILKPGGTTLRFKYKCKQSHYRLDVICRGDVDVKDKKDAMSSPVILNMRVTNLKSKDIRTWRQRIAYLPDRYEDGGHLYFPVYEAGEYLVELSSSPSSLANLRVDFLALKDMFGGFPQNPEKRGQYLLTKEEVKALRRQPASLALANKLLAEQIKRGIGSDAQKLAAWKEKTFLDIWDSRPPRNLHFNNGFRKADWSPFNKLRARIKKDKAAQPLQWNLKKGYGPWEFVHPKGEKSYGPADFQAGKVMGDCVFPDDCTGYFTKDAVPDGMPAGTFYNWAGQALMNKYKAIGKLATKRAHEYLLTGNEMAGWEGVCALIAYADLWPDIDFQTQKADFGGSQFGMNPLGKFVYSGWAWGEAKVLIEAYDSLFPVITKHHGKLAALMRKRIPSVRNRNDIVRLLDINILRHIRDCVDRQVIRSGEGDSEMVCVLAGLAQGPGKAGDWILQLPFTRCHIRMMNRGGIQDHFVSSTATDGCAYIGSVEYAKARPKVAAEIIDAIRRYKAIGGKPLHDLDDPVKYPNVMQGGLFNLNRIVAGGFTPRIGDWGTAADPPTGDEKPLYRQLYRYSFNKTGDSRFAYWLKKWGRQSETNDEWSRIVAAADTLRRSPFLENRTRSMPGFGIAVLEAGVEQDDRIKRTAAVLRTGVGQGHGHCDQLSLLIYAKGIRAQVNNGRRGGRNNSRTTRWHNTLEIDETPFMPKKMGSSGVGWNQTVKDLGGDLSYARGAARSPSHPQVKLFRRDVALIPVGDDDAFVFDVFRVDGGKVHTWCNAGPVSPTNGIAMNVAMRRSALPDDLPGAIREATKNGNSLVPTEQKGYQYVDTYLGGWNLRQQGKGKCGKTTRITWTVKPDALKKYKLDPTRTTHVRNYRLGSKGQILMTAYGQFSDYAIQNAPGRNFVYTRNETKKESLAAIYPTVSETYVHEKPLLKTVKTLKVRGGRSGAMAPSAIHVVTTTGQETIAVMDGDGMETLRTKGVTMQGEFGLVSRRDGEVVQIGLVGGTSLEASGFVIKPDVARYEAEVSSIDVAKNSISVGAVWPTKLLDGENFLIKREKVDHNANYIVTKVTPGQDGSALRLRGGLKVYESAITHFSEDKGSLVMDMPFVLVESDDSYYENMMVLNEKNELLGPALLKADDRFMFLLKPQHQAWRQRIGKIEDIPDTDGDGLRTLKMIATSDITQLLPTKRRLTAGEQMKTLVVTRVNEDGSMMWFREKDPGIVFADSAGVPHRHWPFQDQKLVTEDGKRELQANYPGDEICLGVAGRKLTKQDFPDVDGDGRHAAALVAIAPGDVVTTPSSVSLALVGDGVYRLRANCAVTLKMPGKRIRICQKSGDKLVFNSPTLLSGGAFRIDAKVLAGGNVYIIAGSQDESFEMPLSD